MRFFHSVSFTEPEHLIAVAKAAEDAGFDGIFVSDHVAFPRDLRSKYPYSPDGKPMFGPDTPWPEPWSTIAAMAAVTTRLELMTGVYILPLRHPLEVAKATSTVAVLSGGRVALGVGAGWMEEEFTLLGQPFAKRGRRLEEGVEVLRKVWAGGMVEHHGTHYDFPAVQVSPAPPAPLRVLVGGASDVAFRRAARIGDGWIGSGNAPDDVPALMARLRELRQEAGRAHLPFETVVPLAVPLEPDLCRRLADAGVDTFVSWPFAYTLGPTSTIDAKRRALAEYGTRVIAPSRR